ncbi:hypothetical protein, partial [Sharpea azabuensis]
FGLARGLGSIAYATTAFSIGLFKMALMAIAISVFGVGLYVAMWGDRKIGCFKCRNSNELFTPTFMQYNMRMHLLSTRYLKCPHCKTRTWRKKVMTKEC